ncbi:tryptophanyl-tRNA synthetase [Nocardia transvalensis]|uniref:Tryptophan--tRNA ligase n=1 Tax=Nocardia transvalensis TaxID=37333 RepID=A0A7W9PF89_9NOCA|nr:tryptophan--tRNA ligase [Nocardia transvalensis]MBB5914997.1 tryptophanyl-tRNA synthetase [Nocardia transvalensis]
MSRRLTAFTPSGDLHLGNYFGAIAPLVERQIPGETITFVSDLHALTLDHDPAEVRRRTLEFATVLLAAGVDPDRTVFLVQSHVPEHTELHYLLECVTGYGQAHRMIQFKEKSRGRRQVRMSLLTYPILMAADILLYDAEEIPVGEDQRQHVELARDLAERFNATYAPVLTVPRAVNPSVAARIMDLTDPTRKMSKSLSPAGTLRLLDPPDVLRRKVMRAVTDNDTEITHDPHRKPGIANLLTILSACTGATPDGLSHEFTTYGDVKRTVADAVIATTDPIRHHYTELARDPTTIRATLHHGATTARPQARAKVDSVKNALGLLPAP